MSGFRDVSPLPRRVRGSDRPPLPCPAQCLSGLRSGVRLLDPGGGSASAKGVAALAGAVAALHEGWIVAVKGIGGYHLAARADDEAVVAKLRSRKHR